MSGARTRALAVGASGRGTFGERGRWIEVVDGGNFGHRNLLTVESAAGDEGVPGEQDVPCVAGTIVVADFEQVRLELPGADTVIVRMGDGRPPEPVTGRPRVRWLASGFNTIEVLSEAIPVDFMGTAARDDYSTRERHELLDWHGWIVGDKVFRVIATVISWGVEIVVAEYDVRLVNPPAGSSATLASYSCEFLDLTTRQRARFPSNLYRLHVVNSSGVNNVNYSYLIGVRG